MLFFAQMRFAGSGTACVIFMDSRAEKSGEPGSDPPGANREALAVSGPQYAEMKEA
jgi:hypothetical protein